MGRIFSGFLLSVLLIHIPAVLSATDTDKDGLPDDFEHELLQKFVPGFLISPADCDGRPAEFESGTGEPRTAAKNGTIYGQVYPSIRPERTGFFIEIRYFHLWDRDCGLTAHALDAEHVSALAWSPSSPAPVSDWKAAYWFASAHEDTVCDASHAARGSLLQAEHKGPAVWISYGKHASFLSEKLCGGGCGGESCGSSQLLDISKIVNLGEVHAPANGASWITSPRWPLAAKMQTTDFPELALARMDRSDTTAVIPANDATIPVKSTILATASTAEALIAADQKTDAAVSASGSVVGASLKKSAGGTGNSLSRAARTVWRSLRFLDKKDSQ